jgi:hypothetical protein
VKLSDVLPAQPAEPTLRQLRILTRYAQRRWSHLDPDDVESMVGEAWMTAMRKAKPDVPFADTLLTVLCNLALNASRKHKRRAARLSSADIDIVLATAAADTPEVGHNVVAYPRRSVPALVGISYRQLDYWERTGRLASDVAPSGSGSRAVMTHRSVIGVALVAELMRTNPTHIPAWVDILAAVDNGGVVEWCHDAPAFGRDSGASWLTIDIDHLRHVVTSRAVEVAA